MPIQLISCLQYSMLTYDQAAFLKNLASNPSNTVIGLVRNAADTEDKIAEWRTPNVHILQADVTNYDSLKVGLYILTFYFTS
jgi:hypothetical protein